MNDSILILGVLRCATPMVFACLAAMICQTVGATNYAIEAIMMVSALVGLTTCAITHSPAIAIVAALVAGTLVGFLYMVLSLKFKLNQLASGLALTFLALGITAAAGAAYVGVSAYGLPPVKPGVFQPIALTAGLRNMDWFIAVAFATTGVIALWSLKTNFGLEMRATSLNHKLAEEAGVNLTSIQYGATIISSMLAALAGTYLSLGLTGSWYEGMTSGRGFIAIALMMFAGFHPWRAMALACIVGALQVLQSQIAPTGGADGYLLAMAPFALAMIVMLLTRR